MSTTQKKRHYYSMASYNIPWVKTEITGKQYTALMSQYRKAIKENQKFNKPDDPDSDEHRLDDIKTEVEDKGGHITTFHYIHDGETRVILAESFLKDGYRWT